MNNSMIDNKYYMLTMAYDALIECNTHLSTLRCAIENDFNFSEDKFFSNPLEYGPRTSLNHAACEFKLDAIKFIIRDMGKQNIYKNLIVDEDRILKLFGIGYGSTQKYGTGFNSQDVVDSFNELYPIEDIESILYTQILHTAKGSIPGFFRQGDRKIERFGKQNDGLILHFTKPDYDRSNSNYTSALLKLIEITLVHVSPSNAEHVIVEPGEKYTTFYTKSIKGYKNGKLKVVFKSPDDADTISNLLLQEDTEDVF